MKLHALLLAAGNASRFGSAKQLALLDGLPLVRRAALAALDAGLPLTVVTGAWPLEVTAALQGLSLTLVHNDDWQQGMGGSLGCGFRQMLTGDSEATVVCLADQPLVGGAQLLQLIEAWRATPERIVTAASGDIPSPPCLFPRRYYEELSGWQGTQGARKLLQREAAQVLRIEMPEAAMDVDTPEDYARLLLAPS